MIVNNLNSVIAGLTRNIISNRGYCVMRGMTAMALTATVTLFAACNNENETLPGNKELLTLSTRMDAPQTRATIGNTWSNGDLVKVNLNDGASLNDTYDFTAASDGNLSSSSLYWLSATQTITAKAWYPDTVTYKSAADFSDQSDLQTLDFVFAEAVSNITLGNYASRALTFKHKTAKVKATLRKGEGIADLTGAKVYFYGYKTVTSVNAANGTLTGSDNLWIEARHGAGDTLALLVPQTYAATTSVIKVSLGGDDFYWKPASALPLDGGTAYTFEITVSRTGLTVTLNAPATWDAGSTDAITAGSVINVGTVSASGTDYTYANNIITLTKNACYTLTGSTATNFVKVASGVTATVTLDNVTLGASSSYNVPTIDCEGATVTLKLNGTNAVTGQGNAPAIHAGTNTVLTITSAAGDGLTNGTLNATNNQDTGYAGVISSNDGEEGGTIIINGGTVNVTEQGFGAAIGGGRRGAGTGNAGSGGNITINGGNVTASATSGAAIGGGDEGAGGNITINGGNVTAFATVGAAIGGGGHYGAGGSITINSGTVNITTTGDANGDGGAGIGGGQRGAGGNITISGGEININADGYAAGIGGGSGWSSAAGAGGNISISGGVINAVNAKGVAIGGGSATDPSGAFAGGSGGTINITGGTVVASSGNVWAIGGGKAFGSGSNGVAATLTLGSSYSWWTNTQPDQTGTAAAGTFPGTPFEADDTQKWVKIVGN